MTPPQKILACFSSKDATWVFTDAKGESRQHKAIVPLCWEVVAQVTLTREWQPSSRPASLIKWDLKIFLCNMGSLRGGERSHWFTLFTFFIFFAAVEKNNASYAWSNTICILEGRTGNILENLAFNLSFLWSAMCFLLHLCMYAIFTQEQLK